MCKWHTFLHDSGTSEELRTMKNMIDTMKEIKNEIARIIDAIYAGGYDRQYASANDDAHEFFKRVAVDRCVDDILETQTKLCVYRWFWTAEYHAMILRIEYQTDYGDTNILDFPEDFLTMSTEDITKYVKIHCDSYKRIKEKQNEEYEKVKVDALIEDEKRQLKTLMEKYPEVVDNFMQEK